MQETWRIAEFRFDPQLNQLDGPGNPTHLEPRTTAVLLDLVKHAGEVRTREELLETAWKDAFVTEGALTHCVWELRKAFGDDARKPRFIQTVPRKGYRLIADAKPEDPRRVGTLLRLDGVDVGALPDAATPLASPDGRLLLFDGPAEAVKLALRALAGSGDAPGSRALVHTDEVAVVPARDGSTALGTAERPRLDALWRSVRPGQILLTLGAFDVARRTLDGADAAGLRWSALGAFDVEGFPEPVELFDVAPLSRPPLESAPTVELRPILDRGTILGWRPGPGVPVPQRPHWALVDKLGEGGFGEVWLSQHAKTKDRRVFKFCFEAERLKALQREVTLLRLLKEALGDRDDIVHLLDWNFEEAPYFLEMEHTAAGSLETWADARGGISAVPLADRLELVAQTADALAAAHSVGVLHKDVKPGNILV
ncbi:MAG: winged helix-turn-helix domain-containing protein, partial [Acidobacteriota bacterium]